MRHQESFEATLAANVAVAFFVPALVYLADAIGTTGMLLGAILGLGSGPISTVVQDIPTLLVYFGIVRAFGI